MIRSVFAGLAASSWRKGLVMQISLRRRRLGQLLCMMNVIGLRLLLFNRFLARRLRECVQS